MIGKIIQTKRKEVGLTQAQLADRLGVTAPAVNRWEKDLSFPDATLLAPLARLLKTDLNELFSFYTSLTDKERELVVDRARKLMLEESDEEALAYIDAEIKLNLSDGQLYKEFAGMLLGMHTFRQAHDPLIYLDRIAEYYERALELLPEDAESISYSLMSIYASLGKEDKAQEAWARLRDNTLDKKWVHAEMLFNLKKYDQAIPEIAEGVLRKVISLHENLGLLKSALHLDDKEDLATLAGEKMEQLRSMFELWSGFGLMSQITNAISLYDAESEGQHLSDFVSLQTKNAQISTCALFADVELGGASKEDQTSADLMADIMKALNKLK